MNSFKRGPKGKPRSGTNLGRKGKNTYVTKSGQTIKVNQSLVGKVKAHNEFRQRRRAERLAGMPKGRLERIIFMLNPKRQYKYWFSREGGIMALKITGIGIVVGFITLVGLFAYFRKDLPNLRGDITGGNIGGSIQYFDKTGQTLLWEDYDAVKRIPVKDEDIHKYVKDATIAIEDQEFFKHSGFDVRGILRAGVNNAFSKSDNKQGGSTITQQLVRLTQDGVGREQTYKRKIKELILSIELERTYSKPEILAGYLNAAPYGNVQYGVEAAMRDYFHKPAKDMTLDEAAFLAAIPKSPSFYSPYGPYYEPELLLGRQHYILDLMEQQGMITKEERDAAKKTDTLAKVQEVRPKYAGITAPWFVLTAKEHLEAEFGAQTVSRGGWRVTTTLDLNLQQIAEEQVKNGTAQVKRQGGDSIGFVAEDVKTGQVVALVGGTDFSNATYGQNNYARYRLPPGSSFKPYDFLALIEHNKNFGAGSVLYDTQGPLPGYPCTNKNRPNNGGNCLWDFDFRYPGPLTLRYALGGSRNVPAVKAMLITGVDKTIDTANKLMGTEQDGYKCFYDDELTKEAPCFAASAIGDGAYLRLDNHVHGMASISRNGLEIPKTYILKIEDAGGKTIKQWEPSKGKQVVRPESAYIVADMMSDANASYMSRKPHNYKGHKFSVKTGTTHDAKDGLLLGFSTQYAAGVWVGSHNRRVEMSGFMESMTQPIWQGWMQKAHDNVKPEERIRPSGIKVLPAFIVRSHVGVSSVEPSPSSDLFPPWYEQAGRTSNTKRTIDVVSNKLATDCTPGRAKKEVTDTDASVFSGDTFVNQGAGANTSEQDDVHQCSDIRPSIRLSVTPLSGNQFTLSADVTQGTHPLSSDRFAGTVNFIIDGQVIPSGSHGISQSGVVSVTYTATFSGSKTVTAEVIDSVLYDDTASATITVTNNSLSITSAKVAGVNTKFNWSGGSGTVTIYRKSDNAVLCSDSPNSSCNGDVLKAPAGTQVYAKDSAGISSATFTVTN